jgi:hypothetical protein
MGIYKHREKVKKNNNYNTKSVFKVVRNYRERGSPVCWDTRESWMCALSSPYKSSHTAHSSQKLKLRKPEHASTQQFES